MVDSLTYNRIIWSIHVKVSFATPSPALVSTPDHASQSTYRSGKKAVTKKSLVSKKKSGPNRAISSMVNRSGSVPRTRGQ
jgi:hypothetical protein